MSELLALFSTAGPAMAEAAPILEETITGAPSILGAAAGAGAKAFTMPWGAIFQGLSAGSRLLQGFGGYRAGQLQSKFYTQASQQSLEEGAANKSIAEMRGRAQLGQLKAQAGASGTVPTTGSPMLVYLDSVKNAALTAGQEYYQGQLKSTQFKTQAQLAKMRGSADLTSGIFGGITSLGSLLLAP